MSVEPRLYIDAPLAGGAVLDLDRDQAHYLVNVMRRKQGDGVRLFNGRDGEWRAEVASADRKRASLQIVQQRRSQSAAPDMALYFAPVKKARTDFIVEKATELGVASITPVITQRTQSERVRTDRMQALAREASEQTERLDLPVIHEPVSLTRMLEGWDAARTLMFADESGDSQTEPWGGEHGRARPIAQALAGRERGGQWAMLVGPEGGFSVEERTLLHAQTFVLPVSLGPRILRADTAAAAALSVWQSMLGDW
ncbi:16S rRNA (uracil(1498)-N(3))-methyltransferase [Oceanicaulis sp. LC35]|uniref:16S rRNA (uracil(1498)-N(3))-methyltransferase n=1 Tax=Oceanicaulis sp. LC35 TaxID=3349635 RepID=UPI003F86A13D